MPIVTNCPGCAASLQVPRKLCGRKMFCPKCAQPLVITSGGTAKRDEPFHVSTAPTLAWSGCLPLMLAASVLLPGILVLVLVLRNRNEEERAEREPIPTVSTPATIPEPATALSAATLREEPPPVDPIAPAPSPKADEPLEEPVFTLRQPPNRRSRRRRKTSSSTAASRKAPRPTGSYPLIPAQPRSRVGK